MEAKAGCEALDIWAKFDIFSNSKSFVIDSAGRHENINDNARLSV
jgi:hypothetical protein